MAEYIEREAALADLELYETQVVKNEYALAIAGCRSHIRKLPAADVVPWETLMRYANYFCASVSMPEFVREAKMFYDSTKAAMDGGNIE